VTPYAISGTDAAGCVWILGGGFVIEPSGTTTGTFGENLLFHVNAANPTGTAAPPQISIAKLPANVSMPNQAINNSGVVSGVGTITTGTGSQASTSAQKAILLAPVLLVDNQYSNKPKTIQSLPAQTPNQTDDQYVQQEFSDDCIAYIDPSNGANGTPNMPQLVASLCSGKLHGTPVRWRLEVDYKRPNCFTDYYVTSATTENVFIPSTDENGNPSTSANPAFTGTTDSSKSWQISNDWQGELNKNGFFGGTANLYIWFSSQSQTYPTQPVMTFRIGATNPDQDVAEAYINKNAGQHGNYAYAIAREETAGLVQGRYYNQFYTEYQGGATGTAASAMDWVAWAKGWPTYNLDRNWNGKTHTYKQNGPGGYGIFQLTWTNPLVPRDKLWNWQANVSGGISELDGKVTAATNLYNWLVKNFPSIANCPGYGHFTVYQSILICIYNGNDGFTTVTASNGSSRSSPWKLVNGKWQCTGNYVIKVNQYY
jgi:hypothetical protein